MKTQRSGVNPVVMDVFVFVNIHTQSIPLQCIMAYRQYNINHQIYCYWSVQHCWCRTFIKSYDENSNAVVQLELVARFEPVTPTVPPTPCNNNNTNNNNKKLIKLILPLKKIDSKVISTFKKLL